MSKKGLGRRLDALFPEVDLGDREKGSLREIEVSAIEPNPKQPRKSFDQCKFDELVASIREHGIVQPLVVRPKGGRFELVAGERRWRASQVAGLEKVPVLVREFSEAEVMEIALIENLQREDLNPLEEADAFRLLLDEFHLSQEDLARRLGKSRPQISNTLRLLNLGKVAREEVRAGRLSMGHAKVLLGVEDVDRQGMLAERAVVQGLSVRELEKVSGRSGSEGLPGGRPQGDRRLKPDMLDVENRLREHFGTPVRLVTTEGKGRIEITFFGDEGLSRILDSLGLPESSATAMVKREPFRV
jgi:ParB family chromosome partitioning protein